jgi:hypothetical protein
MTFAKAALTEWVWFALAASLSSLFWNIFFYIKYPAEGLAYFWDFLFMPGDWEFRLPVIVTVGIIYTVRVAVRAIKRIRARS